MLIGKKMDLFIFSLPNRIVFQNVPASTRCGGGSDAAVVEKCYWETLGFIRAGAEEYAAGAYLSRYADPQLLESILRVQRSRGGTRRGAELLVPDRAERRRGRWP